MDDGPTEIFFRRKDLHIVTLVYIYRLRLKSCISLKTCMNKVIPPSEMKEPLSSVKFGEEDFPQKLSVNVFCSVLSIMRPRLRGRFCVI